MSKDTVRVRVAPSPTGDPHVGTAYQALFNYVFARSRGGKFVLRIEDTDRARSSKESESAIFENLRWLGLEWDEGPDVGGPHGPYRQSERLDIYRKYADQLIEAGHAYRSFTTKEDLDAKRTEDRGKGRFENYDRQYRDLSPEESKRRAEAGEPHAVRMKVPLSGECVWRDLLRGEIRKDWESVDDQIILKSDGFPTYHLAVVVDDHLMGITHIIRGEEWISSVPKHVQLYQYLGWQSPVFCHLPLLRNNDKNKSKLSKRKNPTSVRYYRRAGFLPPALLNFMGLMGWYPPDGEEKFTLEKMIEAFSLENISLGGPVFDLEKLRWLNGRYIREDHDAESLRRLLEGWAYGPERLERILPLAQPRMETLADWAYLTTFFFSDVVPFDKDDLTLKGKTPEELVEVLQMAIWSLEKEKDFSGEALEKMFRDFAEKLELKLRDLLLPFYVAVSGEKASTPLFQSMEILGSDMVRMRLRRAVEALGGISSKKLKALEKDYTRLFGPRT
jgi:glutamyl-tRNA synthetase